MVHMYIIIALLWIRYKNVESNKYLNIANRISISIVKHRRKQTNAWLQAKHDEIDERRGGDAYLGLDAVLAAPLNRITVIFF